MAMALEGIRVLDLSQWTAGPYCAQVLSDLGADVIKVEPPGGENGRTAQPQVQGVGLYYPLYARNKRSVTLNLKNPEGQQILQRLVQRSDVLVESFRPGYLDRLGLGYRELRQVNRGIVLVSITGYGHTGPYRDRGSFDMIAQASGGLMSVNGDPDGPPLKVAKAVGAVAAGLHGAVAALAALRHRDATGEGQWIDVALLDSVVALLEAEVPYYGLTGETLPRAGNRQHYTAPTNSYPARDGYVYIAASSDSLWRRFCTAIGRPELIEDPRFRTNADRRANVEETDWVVLDWIADKTVAEAVDRLASAEVPCGPVNDIPAVFHDPRVQAREMIVTATHPTLGEVAVPGQPVKLSETPARSGGAIAEAGQHNAEVYGELLGAGSRELAAWAAAGII